MRLFVANTSGASGFDCSSAGKGEPRKQGALVDTPVDPLRLAFLRYRGGVDTELNVLDADRDLYQTQLDLAQLRLQEILSVVQLYKALGGGWQ